MDRSTTYTMPASVPRPDGKPAPRRPVVRWLSAHRVAPVGPGAAEAEHHEQPWWKVMCLTGVDYFSTLSYLPAIAALAAGAFSPLATLLIVVLTLAGMLPMYRRVAQESPHGQGSVAMLEHLLPFWRGKVFVLVLLGFVATSWIITITLSAADATVHLVENPLAPQFLHGHHVAVTVVLLLILGAVFLKGFTEAVAVAVPLVGVFLGLNAVIIAVGLWEIATTSGALSGWTQALASTGGGPGEVVLLSVLAFPLLVLGLSGFETGVSMMPLVATRGATPAEHLVSRVRNTRKLLTTAALIMSVYLIGSSFVTTVLIPAEEFAEGGAASGRALAYLAHEHLGEGFGTVYDASSILILWFAGASAMAGLLNLVPRYLPRYGMAPEWAKAVRPLVLVFTFVGFLITYHFEADVDAQGGAYATGVLVLMTSAAVAVTLSARRRKQYKRTLAFGIITVMFTYTTAANIVERPDGIKIAAVFILGIIVISLLSRARRSFELHATRVHLDQQALEFMSSNLDGPITIIAHEPHRISAEAYRDKLKSAIEVSHLPLEHEALFLEVIVDDSSDFETELDVRGVIRHGYRILEVHGPVVANTIASVLFHIRDATGLMPHIYFRWTEGNPVVNLLRFLFLGEGEIAPVTREVLREAEPDVTKRPWVHVG